jgi:hypothetical protein
LSWEYASGELSIIIVLVTSKPTRTRSYKEVLRQREESGKMKYFDVLVVRWCGFDDA